MVAFIKTYAYLMEQIATISEMYRPIKIIIFIVLVPYIRFYVYYIHFVRLS